MRDLLCGSPQKRIYPVINPLAPSITFTLTQTPPAPLSPLTEYRALCAAIMRAQEQGKKARREGQRKNEQFNAGRCSATITVFLAVRD